MSSLTLWHAYTHTHTHTHIYIYIYIYTRTYIYECCNLIKEKSSWHVFNYLFPWVLYNENFGFKFSCMFVYEIINASSFVYINTSVCLNTNTDTYAHMCVCVCVFVCVCVCVCVCAFLVHLYVYSTSKNNKQINRMGIFCKINKVVKTTFPPYQKNPEYQQKLLEQFTGFVFI